MIEHDRRETVGGTDGPKVLKFHSARRHLLALPVPRLSLASPRPEMERNRQTTGAETAQSRRSNLEIQIIPPNVRHEPEPSPYPFRVV